MEYAGHTITKISDTSRGTGKIYAASARARANYVGMESYESGAYGAAYMGRAMSAARIRIP